MEKPPPAMHGRKTGRTARRAGQYRRVILRTLLWPWLGLLSRFRERVARAPAAGRILRQDAPFDQVVDVAVGRVLGAFGQLRPFRRGELALEPVQQPVDDLPLPVVERLPGVDFPEPGFPEDARQGEPPRRRRRGPGSRGTTASRG